MKTFWKLLVEIISKNYKCTSKKCFPVSPLLWLTKTALLWWEWPLQKVNIAISNNRPNAPGETVHFRQPIQTAQYHRVDAWLTELIQEMRTNLSLLTVQAYETLKDMTSKTSMDMAQYLKWIDHYPGKHRR